jgi:glutamate/tyrosine decarboxylase-like PLP-dependent enzyme
MPEAPPPVPDLNWDPARARTFADRASDLVETFLRRLPELPVSGRWSQQDVEKGVAVDIPDQPMGDEEIFDYLQELVFDWSMYCGHPRFMAYVSGAGTVPGAVADMVASAVNMNLGGWRLAPSGTEVELALIRWFNRLFGFPDGAGGLLTSGGALANFVALKIARDAKAPWDVRNTGLAGGPPMTVYASEDVHVVTDRAADMLGLGQESVRKIPLDRGYRMRMDALGEAVAVDRAVGRLPIAVVASAGTTATGAIDPLPEIAQLCAAEGLWMHVDAAYGGPAVMAEDLRPLFVGIERADSIAFDPHKWLYTPLSGGCVLVRDGALPARSFAVDPTIIHEDKERSGHGVDLGGLGPQFSRGFQALKIWVSLLAHGRDAYARRISHDAALARYLGAVVDAHPELALAAPVGLSICCFRFVPPDLPRSSEADAYVSELNERIMTEIHLDGRVYYSNAFLDGQWALRVCIVNFRTEATDMDAVADVTVELGRRLDAELRPAALRPGAA